MGELIRIYCDESCHLQNDNIPVMVLGCIWCPAEKSHEIASEIRDIKAQFHHNVNFEIKWNKVSPKQTDFYLALLEYFFNNTNLHFRALVIPDKKILDHDRFEQDYDTWYYKMYFNLLKILLDPKNEYEIYLDIKDTKSANKVKKLHDVLCNNFYDFSRQIIRRVQNVRSDEIEQIQLADLLIGAVCYCNRNLKTSSAKSAFINKMKELSGYELIKSTLLMEDKVNIFVWHARDER